MTSSTHSSAADAASDNSKVNTRKRPLSEKIDYKDMMADEEVNAKKGRGGKARAKSGGMRGGAGGSGGGKVGSGGGGKVGRGSRRDDVVCAICNQFDPSLPSAYTGNKTEWIGCDCNRYSLQIYHHYRETV